MVSFSGNMAIDESTLRSLSMVSEGQAFSESEIVRRSRADRPRVRNRGYDGVVVTSEPTFAEDDTRADVVFRITEGPQVMIDHIIIVGNRRISTRTIERELLLREGEPLGYSALVESRQRLFALGMFRRAQIEPWARGPTDGATCSLRSKSRRRPSSDSAAVSKVVLIEDWRHGCRRGTVRSGAARLLSNRPPQPVGKESPRRSVHPARRPAS